MFNFLLRLFHTCPLDLLSSRLFDDTTFYDPFIQDLKKCKKEVIIESPFITSKRTNILTPILRRLVDKGVKVYVLTRDPNFHEIGMRIQAELAIRNFEIIGVQVLLLTGNPHRKVAILDREILWEGSLNILSQCHSGEIMRRIKSVVLTREMFDFLRLDKII